MAGVIEQVVRLRDEATAVLNTVSASAEEAAQDVDKMTEEMKRADAAMKATRPVATGLAGDMRQLSSATLQHAAHVNKLSNDSVGLRQVTRNLGYQIGDVVQTIQAGGNAWQALAVQATDIAFQFDLAAVASKAWTVAASPLGLALAGVAATMAVVGNQISATNDRLSTHIGQLDKAVEATERLARSQAALSVGSTDVAGFVGDLEIQVALLRGEIDEADVTAGKLGSGLADKLRPQILAVSQAATENAVQIERLNRALSETGLGAERRAEAVTALVAAESKQKELAANLEQLQGLYSRGRVAIDEYTDALTAQAAAEAAASGSGKALAEVMRDNTDKRMALVRGAAASEFGRGIMGGISKPSDFGFDMPQLAKMFSDAFEAAMSRPFNGQSRGAMRMGRAAEATNAALGAVLDPLSALSGMGPQGAALAQTLTLLEAVGREGNDKIVRRLEDLSSNVVQGVAQMPELFLMLIDRLPEAIGRSVAQAIAGLFDKDPGEILKLGLNAQLNILTGGLWGVGKGIAREAGADLPDWMDTGGGSNARTASAMLRRPAMGFQGGGHTTIVNGFVSPHVLNDVAAQAEIDYSPWGVGRGRRSTFGGG